MKLTRIIITTILMLLFINCASQKSDETNNNQDPTPYDVTQPLTGKVGGADFKFASGIARVSLSHADAYQISLWQEQLEDPCNSFGIQDYAIIFAISQTVGSADLDNTHNITFYSYDNGANKNSVATQGKMTISKIENGTIYGSISAFFDQENVAAGTFQVILCDN